ncbi:MAG TPA: hypothetical protein VNS63_19680 [Blastocatellia bacterium]|nr:hypothetical protein [Blastocatellia bacterium]
MTTASSGGYEEHRFGRVVPGDVETVRRKLCDVLEDFNYLLLGEIPIQVKRNQTKSLFNSTVLEYHGRLTIGLKQISEASTLATFDYSVPYLFTKGDKQALEREAEALIALAISTGRTICAGCGAQSTDAVRFCRVCGAPVAGNKLPAELEVMRLTASASAAHQELVFGSVIALLTLIIGAGLLFSGTPIALWAGWIVFLIGDLLAGLYLFAAIRRLRATVNSAAPLQDEPAAETTRSLHEQRAALPPVPASVTERTTGLMDDSKRVQASVNLPRDTDPIP